MARTRDTLACLLFALSLPALAQSKLILPQNQDDIRQLTKRAETGPCKKCGMVTNVRSESRELQQRNVSAPPASSGIGGTLATTPIIGSGTAVKDARKEGIPATYYKITVRYDDGTYAFFEQDDKPLVRKKDRIEIIEGRVELRAN